MKKILLLTIFLMSFKSFAVKHEDGMIIDPNITKIELEFVDGAFTRNTINMKIGGLIVRGLVGRVIEVASINGGDNRSYADYPEGTVKEKKLEEIYVTYLNRIDQAIEQEKLLLVNPYNEAEERIIIVD